jgi:hypothetical protein
MDCPIPASRRAFVTSSACWALLTLAPRAIAQPASTTSGEVDLFAFMLQELGEPQHASRITAEEAANYAGRVPPALIRFWIEHGRGAYLDGLYWICDPAPFAPVLEMIFAGDPEFSPSDMTVVAYTALGALRVWHRRRRIMNVDLLYSTVFNPSESSWHDARTGRPFSEDFSVSALVAANKSTFSAEERSFLAAAIARHGALAPGEVYGFTPALQLGGAARVENLERYQAREHFQILAQMDRFKLTRLTPPEPPKNPYGRLEFVRFIGPPDKP